MSENDDLFEVQTQEKEEKKSKIKEIEESKAQDLSNFYSFVKKIPSLDWVTVILILGEFILLLYGLLLLLGRAPLS